MYTRCPSCRAEICFQPPANAANLPDGYKHRIKCPNCGVTIGVKLPGRDAIAQVQPTFAPQNQGAYSPEPVYNAGIAETVPADAAAAKSSSRAAAKAQKKTGRSRNVMIFIFAALLVVCSVLGYFFAPTGGGVGVEDIFGEDGSVNISAETLLEALYHYDGISVLETLAAGDAEAELIKLTFEESVADGFILVLPVIFFLGALLTAALALIGFIVKKYSRLLNLVLALGLLATAACIVFQSFLFADGAFAPESMTVFFQQIIEGFDFFLFVPAAIGVLHVLFAFIFACIPMKKKAV